MYRGNGGDGPFGESYYAKAPDGLDLPYHWYYDLSGSLHRDWHVLVQRLQLVLDILAHATDDTAGNVEESPVFLAHIDYEKELVFTENWSISRESVREWFEGWMFTKHLDNLRQNHYVPMRYFAWEQRVLDLRARYGLGTNARNDIAQYYLKGYSPEEWAAHDLWGCILIGEPGLLENMRNSQLWSAFDDL